MVNILKRMKMFSVYTKESNYIRYHSDEDEY